MLGLGQVRCIGTDLTLLRTTMALMENEY
jgi:hypothetical protein